MLISRCRWLVIILRWSFRSYPVLPYLSIAMVPGFLLTDDSNMKDGNNSFFPMLQDSLVSFFFSCGASTQFRVMASP